MYNSRTSTSNADFYAVARDLERRLGSLRTFLDAAHELLTRAKLPFSEFRRCSREVGDPTFACLFHDWSLTDVKCFVADRRFNRGISPANLPSNKVSSFAG